MAVDLYCKIWVSRDASCGRNFPSSILSSKKGGWVQFQAGRLAVVVCLFYNRQQQYQSLLTHYKAVCSFTHGVGYPRFMYELAAGLGRVPETTNLTCHTAALDEQPNLSNIVKIIPNKLVKHDQDTANHTCQTCSRDCQPDLSNSLKILPTLLAKHSQDTANHTRHCLYSVCHVCIHYRGWDKRMPTFSL